MNLSFSIADLRSTGWRSAIEQLGRRRSSSDSAALATDVPKGK